MESDQIRTGSDHAGDIKQGMIHHQMNVKGNGRKRAKGSYQLMSKADIGHKMAIHNVQMDVIRFGHPIDFFTQAGKIRRQNRRSDFHTFTTSFFFSFTFFFFYTIYRMILFPLYSTVFPLSLQDLSCILPQMTIKIKSLSVPAIQRGLSSSGRPRGKFPPLFYGMQIFEKGFTPRRTATD